MDLRVFKSALSGFGVWWFWPSRPMGCKKQPPITLACNASAPADLPGRSSHSNRYCRIGEHEKEYDVVYNWTGTGVTGNGTSATVATGSLDPGNYSVNAEVKEGKKGKEGRNPAVRPCTASFTVKAFEPPTISCSANPTTIKPGDTATITSVAVSPQNRPLTYSYSATAGTMTGTGTTASYSSAGAPTGAVGITCNVSDDKGHTVIRQHQPDHRRASASAVRRRTRKRSAPSALRPTKGGRRAWTTKPRPASTRWLWI